MNADPRRAEVAAQLWQVAEHNIVAEWICCDPIDPKHQLCVQGDATLRMTKALLVDDPEAFKPAPLLDAVMRLLPAAGGVVSAAPDQATFSGRIARLVAEDASALRMALYDDLAAYARETGNTGLQHAQIRDHLTEFLFERLLRRVADEAQQQDGTETPFVPPTHYRGRDGTEFCAHAVPVGPDSCRECRDLDQPAAPTRTAASDVLAKAVAALQAKATELSTEAEEEMRRDLEEQAQVWHEAADMVRRVGRKAAPR